MAMDASIAILRPWRDESGTSRMHYVRLGKLGNGDSAEGGEWRCNIGRSTKNASLGQGTYSIIGPYAGNKLKIWPALTNRRTNDNFTSFTHIWSLVGEELGKPFDSHRDYKGGGCRGIGSDSWRCVSG